MSLLYTPARRGRLPAYARELALLSGVPKWVGLLFVFDDFREAKRYEGAPRIVVTPADDALALDLRCAQGAMVYVMAGKWGNHIMPTIIALALAGAREIIFRGPDGEFRDAFTDHELRTIWSLL